MSLNTKKYYFTIVLVILSILFVVPSMIRTYESGKINKVPDNHVIPDQTAHNALMFNEKGRARILISFDDGWDSVYTRAYPVLTRNNQKATVFVITGSVGKGKNYMNLSELATLYNSGWDVSSHSVNHTDLTKIPEPEMRTEINDSYDWLVGHGFTESAKFFAYPYGAHNNRTITALKEKGYVLSKALKDGEMSDKFNVYQSDSRQLLPTIELKNTTTDEQVREYIDAAITTNSTIIFTVNKIVESDADLKTEILLSTFEKMSDYLSLKNTRIDVVTFGEYWSAISSNPTPKPTAVKKTEIKQVNEFASYGDLRTLIDTTIAEKPSKCERIRLLHYLVPTNNATFDSYVNSVIKRIANNYDYTSPDEMWDTCVKNGYDMGDRGIIRTFVIDNRTVITTQ